MVEGFGREHATKGGSYDTGKVIAKEIFGVDPPMPVPYDIISLKGESKKMSSSLGNLVTLGESLQIIPPEILRYFTFKSRPDRQLNFDPELGLYVLMDEYARTEAETLGG
jgi:lysyl-tRNA synthetase class 1